MFIYIFTFLFLCSNTFYPYSFYLFIPLYQIAERRKARTAETLLNYI